MEWFSSIQGFNFARPKKKGVEPKAPIATEVTTKQPIGQISTNDPRPDRDVSARLILCRLKIWSYFCSKNKRRISKTGRPMPRSKGLFRWNSSKKEDVCVLRMPRMVINTHFLRVDGKRHHMFRFGTHEPSNCRKFWDSWGQSDGESSPSLQKVVVKDYLTTTSN